MEIIILYCIYSYIFIIPILKDMNKTLGVNIGANIITFIFAPLIVPFLHGMLIIDKISE